MIEKEELDGRTHEPNLEENLPYLVPGTDGYDRKVIEIASEKGLEENLYTDFSDRTGEFKDAVEGFFEQLQNAIYLLDNPEEGDPVPHIYKANENYFEAQQAFQEFSNSTELADPEIEEEVREYMEELETGLDSVHNLAIERDTLELQDSLQPGKTRAS